MHLRWIHGLALVLLLMTSGCERLPNAPASGGLAPVRGITLVDWTAAGYGSSSASISLNALASTGANTVTILVTAYQSDATASEVRSSDPRTPGIAAVGARMTQANQLGLRIAIKPHVDLDDGQWRGEIAPPDPAAWFDSYRSFVLPWAVLAESQGAAQFVVGTELAGTLGYEPQWRATIAAVRAVFSGQVVYAASWDEANLVPFWDALDLVGVDFYFPVAARGNPSRIELLVGWQPWLDRLKRLRDRAGRDILLTEIGYRSVDGAGMHPYEFGTDRPVDQQEQADLYWAALEATADKPWISGLYWWNWPADGGQADLGTDYTPRGKLAVTELRAAWGGS